MSETTTVIDCRQRPGAARPAAGRRAGLAGLTLVLLVLAAGPAAGFVRTTIQVDGDMWDWQPVLRSAENNVIDPAYNQSDPDLPADGAQDIRRLAVTWDDQFLYFYLQRTSPQGGKLIFYLYLDLDGDGLMGGSDGIFSLRFGNQGADEQALFWYLPTTPGGDAMPGDGGDIAGHAGAQRATISSGSTASNQVEFEMRLAWSSIGGAPGRPLHVQPSFSTINAGTVWATVRDLPAGIQDNAGVLDTGFADFTLSPGTATGATDNWVNFPHQVRNTGNLVQAIDLSAISAAGRRLQIWSDPDGDGDPADGVLLAIDDDSDGDFIDQGDSLTPGADSNGDLKPDSGPLAPGASYSFVLAKELGAAGGNGTLEVTARSSADRSLARTATDSFNANRLSIVPPRSAFGSPGNSVDFAHLVCSRDGSDILVAATASSTLGWPATVLHGGGPAANILVAARSCLPIVARVSVPAGAALGTSDRVTVHVEEVGGNTSDEVTDDLAVDPPISISPPRSSYGLAGTSVFYSHLVRNASSVPRSLELQVLSSAAERPSVWSDPDGDGNPQDGQPIAVTTTLAPFGGEMPILVQVNLPLDLPLGTVDTTTVTVSDSTNATVTASLDDTTEVRLVATFADDPPAPVATVFPGCGTVNVAASGLLPTTIYHFSWYDSSGLLVRVSPGMTRDGTSLVRDVLDLIDSDPLGTWQVTLEWLDVATWRPVDPGGATSFTVLGDLQGSGGVVSSFSTDLVNYPPSGSRMSLAATVNDSSPYSYPRSRLDYTVFRDQNRDQSPNPGETYMQLGGSPGSWAPNRVTCRSVAFPPLQPGDSFVDQSCRDLGPMSFPVNGVWTVQTRWLTDCGYVIATRLIEFNAGCTNTATPDAGPDRDTCAGQAIHIGGGPAEPGFTYLWAPADFLDDPTSAEPWAAPPVTTTYTVNMLDAQGCVGRDEVVVLVEPAPLVEAGPSATICAGGTVRIGTPAVPGNAYLWDPTTGLANPAAAETDATPLVSTTYTLTVTDAVNGCDSVDFVQVDVVAPPVADAGPNRAAPARIGPASCDPGLVYRWSPAAGLDDPTACNPMASPPGVAVYCLTVQEIGAGCTSPPDCVTLGPASCPSPPGEVQDLVATRSGSDVVFGWTADPAAAGGYHVYRVPAKLGLVQPPSAGTLAAATPASSAITSAVEPGAAAPPPATASATFFYRVVGVCADGVSEGP